MDKNMDVFLPAFKPNKRAHGGVKRSAQLRSIAREAGMTVIEPVDGREMLRLFFESPISWVGGLFLVVRMLRFARPKRYPLFLLYATWFYQIIRTYQPEKVHIEISPGRNMVLAYMFSLKGIPFVAYPQNIEFMVPGQVPIDFRSKLAALALELAIYRKALAVKTISEFDTAILACFDVRTVETLPFQPVDPDLSLFQGVKIARESSAQQGILILGTVGNAPTRYGMTRLLGMITASNCGRKYVLAGYGTESLAVLAPPCVEIRGSVGDDVLCEMLIRCEALLVYQPPTTGMLTRIIEAGVAGVPVYVMGGYLQPLSLREKSVYVISSLDQLPSGRE